MNRKKSLIPVAAVLFSVLIIAPAYAVQPVVVEDVWFVMSFTGIESVGNILELGDVLVVKDEVTTWDIYRSPPGTPGTIQIGVATAVINCQFNSKTEKGNVLMYISLTFTESDTVKNPYGVGNLEGILFADLTSMHPTIDILPGYGTGLTVATHGTGAFENAKLTSDVALAPFPWPPPPAPPVVWGMGLFFGVHPNCNGEGTIVYH